MAKARTSCLCLKADHETVEVVNEKETQKNVISSTPLRGCIYEEFGAAQAMGKEDGTYPCEENDGMAYSVIDGVIHEVFSAGTVAIGSFRRQTGTYEDYAYSAAS